jgi:phosphoenolpyruvate-protein kinase (PTS system EI component)
MVCDAAKKENIPVSMCGELASNMEITQQLIYYGVEKLSVSPGIIPSVKQTIANIVTH